MPDPVLPIDPPGVFRRAETESQAEIAQPFQVRRSAYDRLAWLSDTLWYALRLATVLDEDSLALLEAMIRDASEGLIHPNLSAKGIVPLDLDMDSVDVLGQDATLYSYFQRKLQTEQESAEAREKTGREREAAEAREKARQQERKALIDGLPSVRNSAMSLPAELSPFFGWRWHEPSVHPFGIDEKRASREVLARQALFQFIAALRLKADEESVSPVDPSAFRRTALASVEALGRAVVMMLPVESLGSELGQDLMSELREAREQNLPKVVDEVLAQADEKEIPLRQVRISLFRRVKNLICPLDPIC